MNTHNHTNALIHASSPYLLQHAHNPVNWQEWSDDISEQARREDKLILVSIGYSSCHWCHVMEHECFEKEDTAALMNKHFICVKIDREERPDIDQIYMDAVQLLTGRGGWPLNVFTLPDGRPLHGGTYFPKQEWERVLQSLANFYEDKREEAYEFATNLSNGIKRLDQFTMGLNTQDLFPNIMSLLDKWKLQFDLKWGGYNWSPKFPLPNQWELFMGIHHISKDIIFKEACQITLNKMYEGGLFDHLAGGFARYSTDAFWKVPHFEKMLYDNAQLMGTYAMAAKYFQNETFAKVVLQIHQFIQHEMCNDEGAFYSALDADSEGVEGKYYVWSQEEINEYLDENAALFSAYYSVEKHGNWEEGNILFRTSSIDTISENFRLEPNEIEKKIANCKKLLLLERSKRIAPGLDDKIICSWNALMIKGYAQAYQFLGDESYLVQAQKSMNHLLKWSVDGNQVYRILKNGKKSISGFAEDYACLIDALICLFEAGGNENYLWQAKELSDHCLAYFYDTHSGLFFFTTKEQKTIVTRKIEINDDVIPSSNSILAKCLYRLAFYFENSNYEEIQEKMLQTIAEKMNKFPNGFSNWMQLIAWKEKGFTQVILSGPQALEWEKSLNKNFNYQTLIHVLKKESKIPLFIGKTISKTETTAWICKGRTCSLPLQNLDQIELDLPN
ncbi:MAG: thioredoxin domain-containing protein [bacterium]|nr:thioredoxin domain-containing protein [bacterium]